MKVYSAFENIKEKNHCSDKEKETYTLKGNKLVKTGIKENIYEKIQAESDNADIHKIIQKAVNGEPLPNTSSEGIYGDFREMQNMNIHKAHDMAEQTKSNINEIANNLPEEIKEKYNHDNKAIKENIMNENIMKDLKNLELKIQQQQEQQKKDNN